MPSSNTRARWIGILVAIAFVALPVLVWFSTFYTDYLWFGDLGQSDVFVTRLVSGAVTGAVFGVVAFLLLYVNMKIARRMAPRAVLTSVGDLPPQVEEAVINLRAKAGPFLDRIILWGSVAAGFLVGVALSENWDVFRLALTGVKFGDTDPQFGRDIGFYVFSLPALRIVADWLPEHAGVHAARHGARPRGGRRHPARGPVSRRFAPHVKAHLSRAARTHRREQSVRLLSRHLRAQLLAARAGHGRFVHRRERAATGVADTDRHRDAVRHRLDRQHLVPRLAPAHHRAWRVDWGLDTGGWRLPGRSSSSSGSCPTRSPPRRPTSSATSWRHARRSASTR